MKINERIQEMQSKLMKVVTEVSENRKEETVRLLEEYGLDSYSATQLLEAFWNAENAKNEAKNVWNVALESKIGNDNDIAKYQQKEYDTRQNLEKVIAKCAVIIVTGEIEPSSINDEVLTELYEQGIEENQIYNPALRISYHYFIESRMKGEETEQLKNILMQVGKKLVPLKNKIERYKALQKAYKELQSEFTERGITDEKHYQAALAQISLLKNKLKREQDKSVFQIIKSRLSRSKVKELPETTNILPETLRSNVLENMDKIQFEANIDLSTSKNNRQRKVVQEEFQH